MAKLVASDGQSVATPYDKKLREQILIYNPGFWLGWVDNADETALFWREGQRHRTPHAFNPSLVEGL